MNTHVAIARNGNKKIIGHLEADEWTFGKVFGAPTQNLRFDLAVEDSGNSEAVARRLIESLIAYGKDHDMEMIDTFVPKQGSRVADWLTRMGFRSDLGDRMAAVGEGNIRMSLKLSRVTSPSPTGNGDRSVGTASPRTGIGNSRGN